MIKDICNEEGFQEYNIRHHRTTLIKPDIRNIIVITLQMSLNENITSFNDFHICFIFVLDITYIKTYKNLSRNFRKK